LLRVVCGYRAGYGTGNAGWYLVGKLRHLAVLLRATAERRFYLGGCATGKAVYTLTLSRG